MFDTRSVAVHLHIAPGEIQESHIYDGPIYDISHLSGLYLRDYE